MYIKYFNNRWNYAIFLMFGVLNIILTLIYLQDNPFFVGRVLALTLVYMAVGTFGWRWLSEHQSPPMVISYFLVQTLLSNYLQAWVVLETQEAIFPLYVFPLFFQVAALNGPLRWGYWMILWLATTYINLWYEFSPLSITIDTFFMIIFSMTGLALIREASLRHQVQQLLKEIEMRSQLEEEKHQRLAKMRESFIHSATHDLKNPLNIFSGYLGLMETDESVQSNAALTRYMKQMRHSVEQMHTLIMDMLDLAQVSTTPTLNQKVVSLNNLISASVEGFGPQAKEKGITLTFQPAPGSSSAYVDVHRFERVATNLISNALKYTGEGGHVTVRVSTTSHEITVDVSDTGPGIPDEALPHLFEAFYRVRDQHHEAIEGTGLGLAIVKAIVDQHQGQISVSSEVNVGSTFTVKLPIAQAVAQSHAA